MASAFAELDAIDSEREQASRFADLDAIDAERAKPQAFADLDAIDAERAKPSSGLLAQAGAGIAQHLGDVLKGQANPTAIDFANPLTQPLALAAQIPGVKRVMERAGEALTDRANAVPAPQGVLQGGARVGGEVLLPIASMGATMVPAMSGEGLRAAQQEGASPAQTTLRQLSGQVVGGALAMFPNVGQLVRSVGPAARTALNIGGQAAAGAAGEVALNAVAGRPLLENVEDATTQQAIFSAGLEALGAGLRGVRGLRMPQQQPAQPIQGNGARAAGPETAGTGAAEIPVRPDPAPELSSAPPEPVRPGQESPVETPDAVPPPRPQPVEAAGPTTPPEAANDTRPAAAEDLRSLGPALGARVVETQKPELPTTGTQRPAEILPLETSRPVEPGFVPPRYQMAKPVRGPSGAQIVGYKWNSKLEDYVDARGEDRVRRVSDWDAANTSTGTGRDIVHEYFVKHPDGRVTVEGVKSAQNILGVSESRLQSIAKKEQAAQADRLEQLRLEGRRVEEGSAASARDARNDFINRNWSSARSSAENQKIISDVQIYEKDGRYYAKPVAESIDAQMAELGWRKVSAVESVKPAEILPLAQQSAEVGKVVIEDVPVGRQLEALVSAERAKDVRDLQGNSSGWKIVPNPAGATLVSPDGKKMVRFVSSDPRSGAEMLRKRTEAQAWAINNPLKSEPLPAGELVSQPLGVSAPPREESSSSGTITGSNVEQAAEMPVRVEGAAVAPEPQKPSSPPSTQPEAPAYKPPRIARADQPVVDAVLDPQSRALVKDLSKLPGRTLNYLARELGLEAKARSRKALVAEIHAAQPVATAGRHVMARTDIDALVRKHGLRGQLEELQREISDIARQVRTGVIDYGRSMRKIGDQNSAGQWDETRWENAGSVYPGGMNKDTVPALQRFLAGEPMSGKQLAHVQRAINHLTRDWPKEAWEGVTRPEEFPAPRATEEVFREYVAEGRVLPHDADVWLDLNAKTEAINSRGESIDVPVNDNTYRIVTHIPVRDEAGNVTGFDYLVTDDNKTFLRVGEDAILKGEADETTSKTFFDQFTQPPRASEADAGAPAAVQRPAGEVPQSGGPGERSLRPGNRGDEPETLTLQSETRDQRSAREKAAADKAEIARRQNERKTGNAGDLGTGDMFDKTAGENALFTQQNALPEAVVQKGRNLLPVEQQFVNSYGITIQTALETNWIRKNKEFTKRGLGEKVTGYSPSSNSGYEFSSAFEAMAKEKELRAAAAANITPDQRLVDAVWSKMTSDERSAARRNPLVFELEAGVLDPQILKPFADKYGLPLPETGTQRPADFQQVETAKPSVPELRDAAQKKADVAELYSGIPFLNAVPRRARALAANDLPEQPGPLQSNDPAVERRWQAAKLKPTPLRDKLTNAVRAVKNSFTRHFPELDRVRHAPEIEILRQHEAAPQLAQMKAAEDIHAIAGNLGPKKFGVFERLVILPDLLRDIDRGLHEGKELPFGYASRNAVAADLHKFEQIAARNPDLKRAVEQRRVMMNAVRDEMVSRDLLPEGVKDFDDYFHRQVMVHRAMQEASGPGTSAGEVRNQTKGFQRARTGSSKDYNTSYLESEFEVLSQMYAQMATQDTLGRLNRTSNIAPQLREAARAQGVEDWRTLVPEGYTLWQPERGNHFHWGNTLTDRVVEQFLRGEKMLEEGDFKKALVMGQAKDQWAIPKELAKTLDNFGPRPDTLVEKFVAAGIGSWKVWTLLNPLRAAGYNLSNAVGDSDVVMAYDPKIFTYAPQAVRDLKKWVINKDKATPEIEDAVRRGNLSSSFTVAELPDVSQSVLFALLKGEKPGLVKQYWSSVKDYTRWREEVLRLAALRYFKDEQQAGRIRYGASERADVDALRATMPDEVPYKLARELIGDYGNVSQAGQWLRSHLIPFYSWMEINAPRYVRMFKNLPGEGRGTGDVVKVLGAKTAGKAALYTARAAGLYMMLNLWNKTMFPEEERELDIGGRRQLHLILGRREDGTIRTIRMAGALSDALGWFGAEDFPSDVSDVVEGRASVGDKIIEAAKAPVNRIINASSPIKKTVAESLMGATMYPDAFNPRPIRDKVEHIAGLMSAKPIYRYLADRPGPKTDATDKLLSLVTYTTDPGEAAYNVARTIAQEWLEKNARESNPGEPTARQNALYYYKQAVKYKDDRLAQKYWADYVRLGGNTKAAGQSIARAAPAASVPAAYRSAFMQSLTPREREIMSTAEAWYRKTYRP